MKEPSHGAPCPSCQNQYVIVDSVHNTKRIRKCNEYPCNDCPVTTGFPHYTPSQEFKKNIAVKNAMEKARKIPVQVVVQRFQEKPKRKKFSFD